MGEIKTADYFVEHMESRYKGALDSLSVDALSLVVAVIEQDMLRGDKGYVEVDRGGIECRFGALERVVIPVSEQAEYEIGCTLDDFADEDEYHSRKVEIECIRENIYRYILRYIAPKLKENGFFIKVVKTKGFKVELHIDYTGNKASLERSLGNMKYIYGLSTTYSGMNTASNTKDKKHTEKIYVDTSSVYNNSPIPSAESDYKKEQYKEKMAKFSQDILDSVIHSIEYDIENGKDSVTFWFNDIKDMAYDLGYTSNGRTIYDTMVWLSIALAEEYNYKVSFKDNFAAKGNCILAVRK